MAYAMFKISEYKMFVVYTTYKDWFVEYTTYKVWLTPCAR
jgi:hypothetical protein